MGFSAFVRPGKWIAVKLLASRPSKMLPLQLVILRSPSLPPPPRPAHPRRTHGRQVSFRCIEISLVLELPNLHVGAGLTTLPAPYSDLSNRTAAHRATIERPPHARSAHTPAPLPLTQGMWEMNHLWGRLRQSKRSRHAFDQPSGIVKVVTPIPPPIRRIMTRLETAHGDLASPAKLENLPGQLGFPRHRERAVQCT